MAAARGLARRTAARGYTLRERLTIYPRVRAASRSVDRRQDAGAGRAGSPARRARGRRASVPEPTPWQDPEVAWKPRDDRAHVREGRTAPGCARTPTDVYGDFDAHRGHAGVGGAPAASARAPGRGRSAARWRRPPTAGATTHRRRGAGAVPGGGPRARGALRASPTTSAREAVGDEVTYVVNRNINFTNVCYTGCRFCAFAQREIDAESYTLTLDEVADRAEEAWDYGATEVCIQGGLHPDLPGEFYFGPPRRREGAGAGHPHPRVQPDGGPERSATKLGISFARVPHGVPGARAGDDPGDGRRDPRRRGPLGADEGQAPGRHVGGDRPTAHGLGIRELQHDHVRPRRRAAALGGAHPPARRASRTTPAGSRSSCRCRSSTRTRRSTWRARRGPGPTLEENLRMHAVARILLDGRHPERPGVVGEDGHGCCQTILRGGRERFRRHADGGDDQPDGRRGVGDPHGAASSSTTRSARSGASRPMRTTTYERASIARRGRR